MNYNPEKHDLVKPVPFFHFYNPFSGPIGGMITGVLLGITYFIYYSQGLWPALEFIFYVVCTTLFARFIETKKLVLNYFALFFWFAYVVSLLIGLERGENSVKISAFFFLTTLPFLTKSLMMWRKL